MRARVLIAVAVAGCYHRIADRPMKDGGLDGLDGLDGAGSADASIDASTLCWNGVQPPTNFRPCDPDWPTVGPAFTITTATQLDTDVGRLGAGAAPGGMYAYDSTHTVWLIHAAQVDISATLTVVGERPLIIVSEGTVTIGAQIDVSATSTSACGSIDGTTGIEAGGGGGGGGHGGYGGAGGSGIDQGGHVGGGSAGATYSVPSLSPLLPGCRGGSGGGGDTVTSAMYGKGGGALELVSVSAILVKGGTPSGHISAGGGGGIKGFAQAMCSSVSGCAGGGGGGGAGGAILLEAPIIQVNNGGSVCAAGGGGGQGGDPNAVTACESGGTGDCAPGAGGSGACNGGRGGDASNDQPIAGIGGVNGSTYPSGGGGGGGGAGRIRMHLGNNGNYTAGGTVLPAPQLDF